MNLSAGCRFILLLSLFVLSSCGLFKKTFVEKGDLKVKTLERKELETEKQTIDLSTTKEVINVDTNLVIPEKTIERESDKPVTMDSLFKGMSLIKHDLLDINIQIDSATGKIKTLVYLKEQSIPFRFQKETTTQNNIQTTEKSKEKSVKDEKKKERPKTKKTEPENSFWVFAIAGAVLLVIVGLIWWYVPKNPLKSKQ